jgi:hypothetical protein
MLIAHSNLYNLKRYFNRYRQNEHPAAFEFLTSNTFGQILYLPYQTKDNENPSVNHRVIWYGRINKTNKTISKSLSGPDSVCFAYGFFILIESTLRHGANQWRNEFVEALRHFDDFVQNNHLDKKDVYLAIVAPKLHSDTHTGFKQKAREGYNIVLLEGSCLAKICDFSKMAFTARHIDLRQLLSNLVKKLCDSTSFDKFKKETNQLIYEWGKDVLVREKTVFFALRSYEAMKKLGRNIVGSSDILVNLHKDRIFNYYLRILGGVDLISYIKDGLLAEKLACLITTPDEDLFCKVASIDFKGRSIRLVNAVEKING